MIVYADVLFLLNFCMDYLILRVVAKGLNRGKYLAVNAALGGLYGVLAVRYPILGNITFQLLLSAGMIIFSFRTNSASSFAKGFSLFWTAAFLLGGLLYGILSGLGRGVLLNGVFYFDFSLWEFLLLSAISWVFLGIFARVRTAGIKKQIHQVEIFSRGKQVCLSALLDTGCELRDPLTGFPVMVAEYEEIYDILSDEFKGMLTQNCIGPIPERIYQIPFQTVEQGSGELMTAFRPDSVVVSKEKEQIVLTNVLVGIVHKKLTGDQSYTALLHPTMTI